VRGMSITRSWNGRLHVAAAALLAGCVVMTAGLLQVEAAVPQTRIMPLGDSLTLGAYAAGQNGTGGYRAPLWNRLAAAQYAVDFVGSVNGPAPAGVDPNHEGHGGWRIDDITGQIDGWLADSKPDVILLIIGANDIIQGYSVDTAQARMNTLLDRIFTDRPGVKLLVGNLIWAPQPNQYNYDLAKIQDFNSRLPAMVAARVALGRDISLVDMYGLSGLGAANFGSDGVHPNDAGYQKMADVWYAALAPQLNAAVPIALHPANPHYFLWRGSPEVLITSTEHYGAVMNLDFDYIPYLDELQAKGLNLTRLFSGTYCEEWGDPYNTLRPAANRYLTPWARSATPGYANGGNKFDLSAFDPAYFARLKDFVAQARQRGIVVEYVLFCPFYADGQWNLSPMKSANNINGVGTIDRNSVHTLANGGLLAYQDALVVKAAQELNDFDNVYFEICNEPYFGGVTLDWQSHIADTLVAAETPLSRRHLVAQNIANGSTTIPNPNPAVSIFNFHYCDPPNAVAQNWGLNRVIADDETGFDGAGDAAYRTEGWDLIMAGGAIYDNLDWSFTPASEAGNGSAQPGLGGGSATLRTQLGILNQFLHGFNFVAMAPSGAVIKGGVPSGATARALVQVGQAYAIYIRGGTQANLVVDLPAGLWRAEWVNTKTGAVDLGQTVTHGGGNCTLASPAYTEDIALRILPSGADATAPTILSVKAQGVSTQVVVRFSEPISTVSATVLANYAIDRGVTCSAVALSADGATVTLTTSPLAAGVTYVLTVNNIQDRASPANAIAPNTQAMFVYQSVAFYRAINLNGPALVIDGNQWEGKTSTNYSYTGDFFENQGVTLNPATDANRATMIRSSVWNRAGSNVTMTNLPTGDYWVYLYVWEDNNSQSFDISVEGAQVQAGYASGAGGHWDRLGPWPVSIADGTIAVTCSAGDANLSGLEVWQVSPATPAQLAHVAITAPAGGLKCGQGMTPVAFTASTTNGTASVTGVEFFDGAVRLGGATAAGVNAWTYSWDTAAAALGAHSVTARATDGGGLTATSAPVTINIWMPGDSNGDGSVDGLDYNNWQNGYQQPNPTLATGDCNGDGSVDGLDYNVWQNNYNHHGTYASDDFGSLAAAPAPAPAAAAPSAPHLTAMTPAPGTAAAGVASLAIVFDVAVQVGAGAVEVNGQATGAHADYAASLDASGKRLTLTWPQALPPDVYTVRVVSAFVAGSDDEVPLDGDVGDAAAPNLPSGDGSPGGDALLEFTAE